MLPFSVIQLIKKPTRGDIFWVIKKRPASPSSAFQSIRIQLWNNNTSTTKLYVTLVLVLFHLGKLEFTAFLQDLNEMHMNIFVFTIYHPPKLRWIIGPNREHLKENHLKEFTYSLKSACPHIYIWQGNQSCEITIKIVISGVRRHTSVEEHMLSMCEALSSIH